RGEAIPEAVRKFFTAAKTPSALGPRPGDDAMLAAGGRFDLPALLDLLGEFATKEDRAALLDGLQRTVGAALGRDIVKDILPYIGRDWGIRIWAPPGKDADWFPHVVLAVRIEPGPGETPVGETLFRLLDSYALAIVLNHNRVNKDPLTLKRIV